MSVLNEGQHTGEFLLSEPAPLISRGPTAETVTVAAATKLESGHVLGQLSADSKFVEFDNAGSDGSEQAAGILYNECDNSAGVAPADFQATVIKRLAAVRKADLKWKSTLEAADKTAAYADLAAALIIASD